jgi:SWI/SNF-related matrix-associated actin-dependent regulator of chromatin subfamily A-like protein 1
MQRLSRIKSRGPRPEFARSATTVFQPDESIKVPAPEGLSYFPFQRAGIDFLAGSKRALLADEMGLGKSVEVAGLLNYEPGIENVLIVCPASVKINWARELNRWLVSPRSIAVWYGSKNRDLNAEIVIVNYDLLGRFEAEIRGRYWDLIVFDEAHYLKSRTAQRSKAAKRLIPHALRRVCLTGTPMLGKPAELWSLLNLLDPAEWPNFYAFAHRYCDARRAPWGWDFGGATNIPELRQRLHQSGLWLRRRKRDVLAQLPAVRRQIIPLEVEAMEELQAVTSELAGELGVTLEELSYVLDPEKIPFDLMSKIRRVTGSLKVDAALQFIEEEAEGYDQVKIVIFGHHHDVLGKIAASLKSSVLVTGQTSAHVRQEAVDRFQNDSKVHFFVGSTMAMGVGINLTAASHAILVESDWSPGVLHQAESRLHRIGQGNSVLVQYLVIAGSIDEKILAAVHAKMRLIEATIEKPL